MTAETEAWSAQENQRHYDTMMRKPGYRDALLISREAHELCRAIGGDVYPDPNRPPQKAKDVLVKIRALCDEIESKVVLR